MNGVGRRLRGHRSGRHKPARVPKNEPQLRTEVRRRCEFEISSVTHMRLGVETHASQVHGELELEGPRSLRKKSAATCNRDVG